LSSIISISGLSFVHRKVPKARIVDHSTIVLHNIAERRLLPQASFKLFFLAEPFLKPFAVVEALLAWGRATTLFFVIESGKSIWSFT
jgi:hypothetical protein